MTLNSSGEFVFPNSSGVVGYIYTQAPPLSGKTITLDYTVSGYPPAAIVPAPASGSGTPQVRLFFWLNNDDATCSQGNTRLWSVTAAGPLTFGEGVISALVTPNQWSDCNGKVGTMPTLTNVRGVGFTFGAEFYGHGVYWNGAGGAPTFKINRWTIQ